MLNPALCCAEAKVWKFVLVEDLIVVRWHWSHHLPRIPLSPSAVTLPIPAIT